MQQARKEKEPVFTVVSERGIPRQSPEFVVEVSVGSVTATGVGAKKKGAKRSAALKALEILGAVTKCSIEEKETSLFDTEQPSLDTTNSGGKLKRLAVTVRNFLMDMIHSSPSNSRPFANRSEPRRERRSSR